jgi:3-hydroxyacyl-CoA dehydrogenase
MPVLTRRVDDVLVIEIDNPPVNACSIHVRRGLLEAIRILGESPDLCAGVLSGVGRRFVAGADIREFGGPVLEPELPEVMLSLDAGTKPVVAALHGAALGGGLELALACDARVATIPCVFAMPEVSLGIIPGAGGTQRLPRLIGIAGAIRMIAGGERLDAQAALGAGLIDQLSEGDVLLAAVRYAQQLGGRKRRTRDLPIPEANGEQIGAAIEAARRSGRQRPAVLAAIDVIQAAPLLAIDEALTRERELFLQFRQSEEADALRHQFFAVREAKRLDAPAGCAPRPVSTVAIIGAGLMGSGIAITVLDAGMHTILLEHDEAALERGTAHIRDYYAGRVKAGKLSADAAQRSLARLQTGTDWMLLGQADLVIEAVFEEIEVKRSVFTAIDRHARAGAVLATNTSYLDVDTISQATSRAQDVVGLHFFSPANIMKLLEIVRGGRTSPETLLTAMQFARAICKQPVVTGNAFGFIGNRIYNAYRRHCEFMLEDGAWPEQVDAALESFGLAMGPFEVADLSGLDIAWRMRRAQAARRHPDERYVQILDRLCEQGRLGRKAGKGYYIYPDHKRSRETDQEVRNIIVEASVQRGIARCALDDETIQRRALAAMANEAALVLAEGVAARASDIDVVLVHGYGFPRWRGGPVFWARQQGLEALAEAVDELALAEGSRFVRADLSILMDPTS